METKICNKCKEEKKVCEFYKNIKSNDGYMYCCKICRKDNKKKSYAKNRELILLQKKNYYSLNKENILNKIKNKYDSKKPILIERSKKYYYNNKEKIFEKEKDRRKEDIIYKISGNVRKRIRHFLRTNGINRKNKTFDIVGCSPKFLKEHIEKQFTEGMSWDKMGKEIHIDHIVPLSSAKMEEDVYKLCHYTNLQPLWAHENLSKGDKIIMIV
jgi:hypothetical protein